MTERREKVFKETFGAFPTVAARAPGRVNLIGEHTDYNGGYVLPVAVQESICLMARRRAAGGFRVYAADLDSSGEMDAAGTCLKTTESWFSYPRGALHILHEHGVFPPGLDVMITSDLLVGGGVSSSAALTVAFLNLFLFFGEMTISEENIALMAQRVENEFAGVRCGIMDPLASQACRKGHALLVDCRNLRYRHVPVRFPHHTFIVCNTGVRRKLESSAYNRIRNECELAAVMLGVEDLSCLTPELLDAQGHLLDDSQQRRARHVVEENMRVMEAARALQESDPQAMGRILLASHESLRDLYRVSCKELDFMVESAQAVRGWCGGRMVGAGFGGCTVHLVARDRAQDFVRDIRDSYLRATGINADCFEVIPSDGAACWVVS